MANIQILPLEDIMGDRFGLTVQWTVKDNGAERISKAVFIN